MLGVIAMVLLASCVSKKELVATQVKLKNTQDLLNTATVTLNSCLSDKAVADANLTALRDQLSDLRKTNDALITSTEQMTLLTSKGADNLEKTLESLQERDLKINRLQDAITKKDSITLAIVSSLKKSVGIDDPDIEINVEKGVVFISIADKLLFQSGSFNVTEKAKTVLEKVAKVITDKPNFEAMIEGHTDSRSYSNGVLVDNWDLSVKRSTSIIRELQGMGVNPAQLIAAGRSSYVPLTDNETAINRAKNRRTRVVVLPKIDQFYEMIENEVKELLFILEKNYYQSIKIQTINFTKKGEQVFSFQYNEDISASFSEPKKYLFEPNSAILKAGGFSQISQQLKIDKLHKHSHLYTSNKLIDFPGRCFEIIHEISYDKKLLKKLIPSKKANITTRNFPETVDQIRKKTGIKDGGNQYLFFTTNFKSDYIVLICKKI